MEVCERCGGLGWYDSYSDNMYMDTNTCYKCDHGYVFEEGELSKLKFNKLKNIL
jgi:hypothetical protein